MKNNENLPFLNANKTKKTKAKLNKKRLLIIFSITFAAVSLLCVTLASMFTPSIDVPVLQNDENSVNTMSSNDFKGRMDPRLKSIEMDEQISPQKTDTQTTMQPTPDQEMQNNTNINDQISKNQNKEDNELPYDSRIDDQTLQDDRQDQTFVDDTAQERPKIQQQKPLQTAPQLKSVQMQQQTQPLQSPSAPKAQKNLDLRDKVDIKPEQTSMVKVMVGSYSSPYEARKASQELSNSNLNVTPFVKENNGMYTIQVGSFTNSQKAENLADELRKRNIAPRVIQD